jgi:hypothetical protein
MPCNRIATGACGVAHWAGALKETFMSGQQKPTPSSEQKSSGKHGVLQEKDEFRKPEHHSQAEEGKAKDELKHMGEKSGARK